MPADVNAAPVPRSYWLRVAHRAWNDIRPDHIPGGRVVGLALTALVVGGPLVVRYFLDGPQTLREPLETLGLTLLVSLVLLIVSFAVHVLWIPPALDRELRGLLDQQRATALFPLAIGFEPTDETCVARWEPNAVNSSDEVTFRLQLRNLSAARVDGVRALITRGPRQADGTQLANVLLKSFPIGETIITVEAGSVPAYVEVVRGEVSDADQPQPFTRLTFETEPEALCDLDEARVTIDVLVTTPTGSKPATFIIDRADGKLAGSLLTS